MSLATATTPRNNQSQIIPTAAGAGDGSSSFPPSSNDLCSSRSESFRKLDAGVLKTTSPQKRLSWLRSQIIGNEAEFDSPFGKRRITYADHTASGRSLHYIENFIVSDVLPYYGNTHTCDSYVGRRTTKMAEEAAAYIKQRLGGGEDDAVLFCGSGTTAAIKRLQEVMGITVPSILRERYLTKCLTGDEERWVVFVGPYEHHSNLLTWRQSLAEVVEIGLDEDGLLDIEALRRELGSGKFTNRPILGSFSACSNVTGICSDTRAIAELLHRHGGFVCFDFAASGPYTKIDMRAGAYDGYDAIFLSPHKFVGGPGTPGILLISKALYRLGSSPPSTCGGGTVDYVNGFDEQHTLYIEDIESHEKGGTPPIIQTIRAALAFWIKEYISHPVIQTQEHLFIGKALKRLTPNKNIIILGMKNNTAVKRQAIMSFLILSTEQRRQQVSSSTLDMWAETGEVVGKPLHGAFIAVLLNDLFGIQARGGCACAGPYGHRLLGVDEGASLAIRSAILKGYLGVKPGWARISFPYYMSGEEFEFILAAVEFLAIYGQRFLHLYRFDFRSGCWTLDGIGEFRELVKKLGVTKSSASSSGGGNRYGVERGGLVSEFSSYLEVAKNIANLLPKFPSEREVPQDLDPDVLHFRV